MRQSESICLNIIQNIKTSKLIINKRCINLPTLKTAQPVRKYPGHIPLTCTQTHAWLGQYRQDVQLLSSGKYTEVPWPNQGLKLDWKLFKWGIQVSYWDNDNNSSRTPNNFESMLTMTDNFLSVYWQSQN